jgi:hypothetical protein
MFSATSSGLGTCWIGLGAHIRDKESLAQIGVPSDCRIIAPIIVGYPASIPPASERHTPDILKVMSACNTSHRLRDDSIDRENMLFEIRHDTVGFSAGLGNLCCGDKGIRVP